MSKLFDINLQHTPLANQLDDEAKVFVKEIFERYTALGCSPWEITQIIHHSLDYLAALTICHMQQDGRLPSRGMDVNSKEYQENDRLRFQAHEASPARVREREIESSLKKKNRKSFSKKKKKSHR